MNDAPTTWALVVGIDEYDAPSLPRLTGAGNDAAAFVRWLRRLGVPDSNILLHAVPSTASRVTLQALGRPYMGAKEPEIWSSVSSLSKETSGTRLFVFLSGHGLYDPATRRMFLTQEAGVDDAWVNLGLDQYIELFLSMSFPQQFLILDGCQNYGFPPNRRSPLIASMHPGVAGFTAKPANSLVACYAASQDQFAVEIEGRGAFSRRLLPALDLDTPYLDAVDFDFVTGARTINIRKLMDWVIPTVQADVQAVTQQFIQVPQIAVFGKGQSERAVPICRLPDIPTSQFRLDVQPPEALPDVRLVQVAIDEDPYWSRPIKPPPQVAVPVVSYLPKGKRVIAECRVREEAPWDAVKGRFEFRADSDNAQTFELTPRPVSPVLPPVPIDGISVKLRGPQGNPAFEMSPSGRYQEVGRRLGLDAEPADGQEVAQGVVIQRHEDGPDFAVEPGVGDAEQVASEWAASIREVVPSEVTISTIFRGGAPSPPKPNLRFTLSRGGARGLAGVLLDLPVLSIVESDESGRRPMSLRAVEAKPFVSVDPGQVRIHIDLPWGTWTGSTRAPTQGHATIELPASVGRPPLRVMLNQELGRTGSLILGTGGDPLRGTVRDGILSDDEANLVAGDPATAAWALMEGPNAPAISTPVAVLHGSTPVAFPLPRRPIALDRSSGSLRLEPLSDLPVPEWDLVVGTGRLDVLSVEQAVKLTRQKWQDEILGLAGAYAVYAAHRRDYLREVVQNLRSLGHRSFDIDLLATSLEHKRGEELSKDAATRLNRWAERGAVPWFRWGVPLALDLLATAPDQRRLSRWRDTLASIEQELSPTSTWTSWAPRKAS